jgi:AcrR family transcriptional regulator
MNTARKRKQLNDPKTKAKLLAAAQQAFSQHGYAETGIRDIAAIAGVSSTLLIRYFGSKAKLFEAALAGMIPPPTLWSYFAKDRFGEFLAQTILSAQFDLKLPSILTLAVGSASTRGITTKVTADHVIAPLAKWLGPPNAEARALQIMMLSMGFVVYARELPVLPAETVMGRPLVKWFIRTVQDVIDQAEDPLVGKP